MHTQQVIRVFMTRLRLMPVVLVALAFAFGISEMAVTTAAAEVAPAPFAATDATAHAAAERPARADKASANKAASAFDADNWATPAVRAINPQVLRLALGASRCAVASGDVEHPSTLTIIDYSKPSVEPRLWVLDLDSRALLYEELVSHGQGSGGNLATKFSNQPDSHQTSIGLFVTDQPYVGRNGYSLRLDGLDKGFNDRARERAIVMHGAPYVNSGITRSLGRLGRSHGCPAVRDAVARELIDRVKGGNLVFSYYPDAEWLKHSKYLGTCGN